MENEKWEEIMKKRYGICAMTALAIMMAAAAVSGCSSKTEEQTESVSESVRTQEENRSRETEEPTGKDVLLFETTDLEGETVDETVFSGKKLTMVNVWATYCAPCISEMPDLGEIAAEYADKDFQIIGIVSDVQTGDDAAAAKELVSETGASYTHLLLNQEIYMAFLNGVTSVPTTFFIDEEGNRIGETYIGSRDKSEWTEIIEGLLQE